MPGRVVTARTGANDELYNSYSNYMDAVDGYNLTLTIDATIQSYAEQILEEGIEAYDVQNGGFVHRDEPQDREPFWPWPAPRTSTPTTTPPSSTVCSRSEASSDVQRDL